MTDAWLSVLNDGDDRLLCQDAHSRFSMRCLRARINQLQTAILKSQLPRWVLYDADGLGFLCALFALLVSGREIIVPASAHSSAILALMQADTGLIGQHPQLRERIDIEVSADQAILEPALKHRIAPVGGWGQVSFCTSGSSGQPKLITKSAQQLFLEVKILQHTLQLGTNTLCIPLVPHIHIYGLTFAFLLPLFAGSQFYLPRKAGLLGAVESLQLDASAQVDRSGDGVGDRPGDRPGDRLVVITSPTLGRQAERLRVLAESGSLASPDRPTPIGKVFCAGGKLTAANAQRMRQLFDCPVTEVFGSTETGAVASRQHQAQSPSRPPPWQLFAGLNPMVRQRGHFVDAAPGASGELALWGGHVEGSRAVPIASGDKVNFIDHRQFELLGRNNRICKIEGKRVSLDHLVESLENCCLVNEAVLLPHKQHAREVLLCGVVLSEQGVASYQRFGKPATDLAIREYLLGLFEPVVVPRSIRYLDAIPRNEMGKTPQRVVAELLVAAVSPELPLVEAATLGQAKVNLALKIPLELRFLRGHFDSRPLVPGVILLHWVYYFSAEYLNYRLDPSRVNRLKFVNPIMPGDKLTLTLERSLDKLGFAYAQQNYKLASGQVFLTADAVDV